jgi:hypothetical protein
MNKPEMLNGRAHIDLDAPLKAKTVDEKVADVYNNQKSSKMVDKDNNNISDYIQKPTEKKAKVTNNKTTTKDNNTTTTKKKSKGSDWAAMQKKSAAKDPRYGKMSPEEYKAEALRQFKSKKEGKGWDAMGKYDSKGNKKKESVEVKIEVASGPTKPEDTKKVGKGNIDVSGYEKDNIYDLQAEKHKEKDMRLEKKQDKRNERMKKTDEYIEKNKAVKGEIGKNIGRFFKRCWW